MMNKLRISGKHYTQLKQHLYPGDNNEAVAVALCGKTMHNKNYILTIHDVFLIPYERCMTREPNLVEWPTEVILPVIERAKAMNMSILKIHSHPTGYEDFSETDNKSDKELFASLDTILDNNQPNASCIMLSNGRIFGRFITDEFVVQPIEQVFVAGSTIYNWLYSSVRKSVDDNLQVRNMQAFGEGTIRVLNSMKVGVIGCSGTGSPIIEQLTRLGVGEIVLIDPDYIDKANLNRIINSTSEDANNKVGKVEVMKRAIEEAGFGTKVHVFPTHVTDYNAVKELADCDVIFGCVDGVEGRHVANQVSSFYVIPYFDVAVRLDADFKDGVSGIYGTVHYIQPGGSSLFSRQVYDLQQLESEAMRRVDQNMYNERVRSKYLASVNESRPAVISVNMQVAATAVNDFLARLHPYRGVDNSEVDLIRIFFNDISMYYEKSSSPCVYFGSMVGRGDVEPLLDNPGLSNDKKAA